MQVNTTDDPAELGPQNHIFVALKAHSILSIVEGSVKDLGQVVC